MELFNLWTSPEKLLHRIAVDAQHVGLVHVRSEVRFTRTVWLIDSRPTKFRMDSEECFRQNRGFILIPDSLEPVLSQHFTTMPQDVPDLGCVLRIHKGLEFLRGKDQQQARMMYEPHRVRIGGSHHPRSRGKAVRYQHVRGAQFLGEGRLSLEES